MQTIEFEAKSYDGIIRIFWKEYCESLRKEYDQEEF